MARIVYRDENYQTFYVDVNAQQTEVTIGRNPGNKIVIQSKSLSRYHAKIVFQNGHYYLIDLKSSNGSFVNNQRVSQQEIHPGEKLRFGEVTVDFIDEMRAGAPAATNAPQMAMPGFSNRPPLPSAPAAPKLMAPQLQPLQHAAANQPDLRSVNLRPITTQGTYRPTMPNQPIFDDEMARVAASQIAANASTPQNQVMPPNAPPMGFNPNSMGINPNLRVNPNNRPLTPPAPNATPDFSAQNPSDLPNATLDPAAPPMGFNPNSMGLNPNLRVNPNNRPLTPPAPNANSDFSAQNPGDLPNAMLDPAAPPMGFNPNSMGLNPSMRVNPNNRPLLSPVPDANPEFNAPNLGDAPNPTLDPAAPPMSFNPNSMGLPSGAPVNPNNRQLTPPIPDANPEFNAPNPSDEPNAMLDPAAPPMGFNPNSMGLPLQTPAQSAQAPQPNDAYSNPNFGSPVPAADNAPSIDAANSGPNAQNYAPLDPVALQDGLPVNVSLPGGLPQTPEDENLPDDSASNDIPPQNDDAQSHDSALNEPCATNASDDHSDNVRAASQELHLPTSTASRSSANHGRIDASAPGRVPVANRRRATADNISVSDAARRPARATNYARAQVSDTPSQHMHAPAPAMRTGRPPMPRQRAGAPFAPREHDNLYNRTENRAGAHLAFSTDDQETEVPKDPILANADIPVDDIPNPQTSAPAADFLIHDAPQAEDDAQTLAAPTPDENSENLDDLSASADNAIEAMPIQNHQADQGFEENPQTSAFDVCPSSDELDAGDAQLDEENSNESDLDRIPSVECNANDLPSNDQNSDYLPSNVQDSKDLQSNEQNTNHTHLDEQKSVSQAIDELSRTHQTELDALKAERDAQFDAYKKEIETLKAECDVLKAERDAQFDTYKKEIETLKAERDALKAERDAQKDAHQAELDALKANFEQEIDTNQTTFELELSESEENARNLQDELDSVNAQLQAARDELQKLKNDAAENSKNDAARALIPKWQSRFNALLQYAKVFERAVDKLDVARAEPKSTEYVRSMIDMIRFCADDLNQS